MHFCQWNAVWNLFKSIHVTHRVQVMHIYLCMLPPGCKNWQLSIEYLRINDSKIESKDNNFRTRIRITKSANIRSDSNLARVGGIQVTLLNSSVEEIFQFAKMPVSFFESLYILRVSLQLICGDTCEIWTWYSIAIQCFDNLARYKDCDRSEGNIWGPFYQHGLTLISAWISNHMPSKKWDEITYPFPNFNSATVEVWVWINNFIPRIIMGVINNPCWD